MLTHLLLIFNLLLLATAQPLDHYRNVHKDHGNINFHKMLQSPVRTKRTTDQIVADCMKVASTEGHYFYKAAEETDTVCGIFLFTEPDQTIEVYFNYLNVPCDDGGLVSFVDGWELNGEFFPSENDHPKPMQSRFSEFCGQRKPKSIFQSSQNAALIQYRVPRRGSGFSFIVRFLKNRTPCNVLLQDTEGVYTLRNYGKRSNCSISAIFPAAGRLLSLNVGLSGGRAAMEMETGTLYKCQKRGLDDYVQIGGSDGLDSSHMYLAESLCGINSKPGPGEVVVFCGVTTVRLVSSGVYDNSVTVSLRKADENDISPAATICPLPEF